MELRKLKGKLFKILWSRLGRNIIFWSILTGHWLYGEPIPKDYAPVWYVLFRVCMWTLMFILTYFNNLFLIPKLLTKKKYWAYIISALALSYVIGFAMALEFNYMGHVFPKIQISQVSFITSLIKIDYSWEAMHYGARHYFFFMLLYVCMFNMAWYMAEYANQQKILEQTIKKQMETELNFLKGQLNPHFLFNNLNNLYGLALTGSKDTAGAILQLSSILRYLLYESNVENVSFEKEREVMKAYIDVELLRLPETHDLHFDITADAVYQLPPLLWLPVLENAFKHGTRVITDNYYIEYKFEIKDNVLTIYSKNNYKVNGIKEKSGGIGLENMRKRLALLYPGKHSLKTTRDDHFFTTELKVNLA